MTTAQSENVSNLLPPADLAGEIDRLTEELSRERDRNLRTLADFTNYRRRIERDGSKLAEEAKRALILPLLDIIDDLDKALRWEHLDREPFARGIRIIHQKLIALLDAHGVRPFESVGESFTPERHEAVAMVENDDGRPGIVVDELRRGYLLNDQLLRAAQVRVAG